MLVFLYIFVDTWNIPFMSQSDDKYGCLSVSIWVTSFDMKDIFPKRFGLNTFHVDVYRKNRSLFTMYYTISVLILVSYLDDPWGVSNLITAPFVLKV